MRQGFNAGVKSQRQGECSFSPFLLVSSPLVPFPSSHFPPSYPGKFIGLDIIWNVIDITQMIDENSTFRCAYINPGWLHIARIYRIYNYRADFITGSGHWRWCSLLLSINTQQSERSEKHYHKPMRSTSPPIFLITPVTAADHDLIAWDRSSKSIDPNTLATSMKYTSRNGKSPEGLRSMCTILKSDNAKHRIASLSDCFSEVHKRIRARPSILCRAAAGSFTSRSRTTT